MSRKLYFKTTYLFLTLLLTFVIQSGYAAANFPVKDVSSNHQNEVSTTKRAKPFKLKFFKKTRTKEKNEKHFGLLAILALVFSLASLSLLPITNLGAIVAGLFFVASCLLAYYGTSKDTYKRLARLTLIIDLVIVLSSLLGLWISTILSL